MKKFLSLLLLFGGIAFGQNDIPTDYFSNPLDINMILSGNFGEMRANHIHSGLDLNTQQREALPAYAPADADVGRINGQHYRYGTALYLLHPNGHTRGSGHLRSYAGEIEKYVKDTQYKKETFEVELFPYKTLLPVKKGDIIAYTGNTGGSGGPHLHYEIRDSSQRPMNPLLFGVEIPDTKKPIISAVFAYPIAEDSHINQ